ncbi:unnamed protein product [Adineta ricciae]|uniref:Uncharacterized protein n=1 Tax=Adineta ricciae TaxID=249248 RepID=A0A816FKV6_ADIRI|nr:unnamed protein product [Adineta ricciae]
MRDCKQNTRCFLNFCIDYEFSIHIHDHQSKYYFYLLQIRYIVLDGGNDDAAADGNSLQGSTTQAQGTSVSLGASHGIDQMITNSLSATYTDTSDNMNADGVSSNEIGNDTHTYSTPLGLYIL